MPSYLVTGAGGQLGQCFQAVAGQYPDYKLIFASRDKVDLNRPETLAEVYSQTPFEGILNCAAYTQVDLAESEQTKAFEINEKGVGHLIDFALQRQLKIIHFSTDFVFDGSQKYPYTEKDPPYPLSVYGQSKWAGEQLLEAAALPTVIIRTSWLFSPYGANFVKTILNKAKRKEALEVVADQWGMPTSGLDLAEAVLQCLGHPQFFDFSLYHFAQGPVSSWYGFAQKILELSECETPLSPTTTSAYPRAARRPQNSALATARFQKVLSLQPRNWEAALADCLQKIQADEAF